MPFGVKQGPPLKRSKRGKIGHFGAIPWSKMDHFGLNGLNSRTVQRVSF